MGTAQFGAALFLRVGNQELLEKEVEKLPTCNGLLKW